MIAYLNEKFCQKRANKLIANGHTCELFSMIKREIFLQKEGDFRICKKQRRKF
jgi:hypothetical protein